VNWPTPSTTDGKSGRNRTAKRSEGAREVNDGLTLTDMLWLGYPLDGPGTPGHMPAERHLDTPVRLRPKVSATFVEWLMNFPSLYWTLPEPSSRDRAGWVKSQRAMVEQFFS
jgi:hypothetical protein